MIRCMGSGFPLARESHHMRVRWVLIFSEVLCPFAADLSPDLVQEVHGFQGG
jgi:hypothetical protein